MHPTSGKCILEPGESEKVSWKKAGRFPALHVGSRGIRKEEAPSPLALSTIAEEPSLPLVEVAWVKANASASWLVRLVHLPPTAPGLPQRGSLVHFHPTPLQHKQCLPSRSPQACRESRILTTAVYLIHEVEDCVNQNVEGRSPRDQECPPPPPIIL